MATRFSQAIPRLLAARMNETVADARYHWDNTKRDPRRCQVVQWTQSGEGRFEMRGKVMSVPAGHAMLFTMFEESRYYHPGAGHGPWRFHWLNLDGFEAAWRELRAKHGSIVPIDKAGVAAGLFEEVFRLHRAHKFRDRYHAAEMLHRFVLALFRELEEGASLAAGAVAHGLALIEQLHTQPANIKEIASRLGMSREHFIREFARIHGESPGRRLRRLRLDHARRLIESTSLPCAEVAAQCGFTSAAHFSRAFRARFGRAPSAGRA